MYITHPSVCGSPINLFCLSQYARSYLYLSPLFPLFQYNRELYDASVVDSIRDNVEYIGKIIFYVAADDSQVFIQFSLTAQLNLIYFHDDEEKMIEWLHAAYCMMVTGHHQIQRRMHVGKIEMMRKN